MKNRQASEFDAEHTVHKLREQRGAVTFPQPSPEQVAAELEQIRLLEKAIHQENQ